MAAVNLTRESIRVLSNNVKRQMQVEKVQISKDFLGELQARDEFVPNDQITSYVTSTNAKNKYEDIDRFWKQMEQSPKYWLKKFIYIPEREGADLNERIAEAVVKANAIIERQYQSYPRISSTGHLKQSVITEVNGDRTFNTTPAILASPNTAYVQIYNTAEYASTAEARAVYVTQQRGLIFYAANRIQTQYPDLGIRYSYTAQSEHGLPHKYDIPVLTISSKANARGKWARPGRNIRSRRRDDRRAANLFRRFRENNLGE